nr:alpha/beta hydrolase [Lachnospiraceae bacterium]
YVIPLLEKDFHLIIPALPGYDPDQKEDFTSIEEIAAAIERWFKEKEIPEVECVYGCSMGGAVAAKLLANNYEMPKRVVTDCPFIEYWVADAEEKDRTWRACSVSSRKTRQENQKTLLQISMEDISYKG